MEELGRRLITIANKSNHKNYTRTGKQLRKQKWKKKHIYGHFRRQIKEIGYKIICIWLHRGNLKRETESLFTAAQNNGIKTKARIDKTRVNSKWRLWGQREDSVTCIISK